MGAGATLHLRGPGRGHGAGQPLGLQRHGGQGRLPAAAPGQPVGTLRRRLPVRGRRRRRVHHRPGLGRPRHDLRERRPPGRDRALRAPAPPGGGGPGPGPSPARPAAPEQLPGGGPPSRRAPGRLPPDPIPPGATGGRPPAPGPAGGALSLRARGPGPPGRALPGGLRHPGRGAGPAPGGGGRRAHGDRGLGGAGLHPGPAGLRPGLRAAGLAPGADPGLHPARLRHHGAHPGPGPAADGRPGRAGRRDRHPPRLPAGAAGHRPSLRRGAAGA